MEAAYFQTKKDYTLILLFTFLNYKWTKEKLEAQGWYYFLNNLLSW
jgi:hypothetical protein